MNASAISVLRVSRDNAHLLELVALLDADLNSRYGIVQAQYDQFNSLATVDAAVVAQLNGQPIGCGCYRRIDETTAEIKRMFVRPENRGSSAAARLRMRSIDDGAKRLGVPPPKNTETSGRPLQPAAAYSRSSSSARRYATSGSPPAGARCELKSQYGHFRTHHGRCT